MRDEEQGGACTHHAGEAAELDNFIAGFSFWGINLRKETNMRNLTIIENGLVPIYEDREERKLVNAREMWEYLESGMEFNHWIRNRIDKYGFIEGEDFSLILAKSTGGRRAKEYFIAIDMAKELGMVENNEKGRMIRKYFIEAEKRLLSGNAVLTKKEKAQFDRDERSRQRLEVMDRNSKNRQVALLKSVAEDFGQYLSDVAKEAIAAKITNILYGGELVALPESKRTYTAGEIGKMCGGITGTMVGRIANDHGLKTPENGIYVLDKSAYSCKQVSTFRYYEGVVCKINEILGSAIEKQVETIMGDAREDNNGDTSA